MKNFTCRRIVSSQTSLSSVFISPHLPPCSSLSPSLLLPASFSLLYRYNSHIHTCIHTCRTRTQQQPRSSGIATAHCGSCFRLNVFFFSYSSSPPFSFVRDLRYINRMNGGPVPEQQQKLWCLPIFWRNQIHSLLNRVAPPYSPDSFSRSYERQRGHIVCVCVCVCMCLGRVCVCVCVLLHDVSCISFESIILFSTTSPPFSRSVTQTSELLALSFIFLLSQSSLLLSYCVTGWNCAMCLTCTSFFYPPPLHISTQKKTHKHTHTRYAELFFI